MQPRTTSNKWFRLKGRNRESKNVSKGNEAMIVATLILQVMRNHEGAGLSAPNRCICLQQPVLIQMTATLNSKQVTRSVTESKPRSGAGATMEDTESLQLVPFGKHLAEQHW